MHDARRELAGAMHVTVGTDVGSCLPGVCLISRQLAHPHTFHSVCPQELGPQEGLGTLWSFEGPLTGPNHLTFLA